MKTVNKMMLVAVAATALAMVNSVLADEGIVGPPRALQTLKELGKSSGSASDVLDRSVKSASPRFAANEASWRQVSGSAGDNIDRSATAMTPKIHSQMGGSAYQVAPIK